MSALFQIRHALSADLDQVLAIERAAAEAPHWPRSTYETIVANHSATRARTQFRSEYLNQPPHTPSPKRILLVADRIAHARDCPQSVIGLAVAMLVPALRGSSPIPAELESIAVVASARRQGVARALCEAIIRFAQNHHAPALELEVRVSNIAAISLYTSIGFVSFGRRPRYYQSPEEDALLLRLSWSTPEPP